MCLEKIYKEVWSRYPGRPWTYVIRDWYKKYPLLWIGGCTFIGVCLGHLFW